MTGTPLQNDLIELNNLLTFLLPNVFAGQGMGEAGRGERGGALVGAWAQSMAHMDKGLGEGPSARGWGEMDRE